MFVRAFQHKKGLCKSAGLYLKKLSMLSYFTTCTVFIYRERACARCGGCDSHLQFPFVCVCIFPAASYSQPSESAVRGKRGGKQHT